MLFSLVSMTELAIAPALNSTLIPGHARTSNTDNPGSTSGSAPAASNNNALDANNGAPGPSSGGNGENAWW